MDLGVSSVVECSTKSKTVILQMMKSHGCQCILNWVWKWNRFAAWFKDEKFVVATCIHPKFKLDWIDDEITIRSHRKPIASKIAILKEKEKTIKIKKVPILFWFVFLDFFKVRFYSEFIPIKIPINSADHCLHILLNKTIITSFFHGNRELYWFRFLIFDSWIWFWLESSVFDSVLKIS